MKKTIRRIVTILAVFLFILSGYKLWDILTTYHAESQANAEVAEQFVQTVPRPTVPPTRPAPPDSEETLPDESVPPTEPKEYAPIAVDFQALLNANAYVVGWIYSPDTNINYPIVQTENNQDYLRRGLDGSYRHGGTIFLDYRCAGDFSEYNSILYGHNLLDSTMFGTLERYKKQSYYEAHPTLYLLTPEGDYRVDLIAGLSLDANSALYETDHTRLSHQDFLEEILPQSDFQTNYPIEEVTRTLTLSTCSYDYSSARYIIVGALTPLDKP